MKPTTIKDIAKALGINPSTVSRGLKKHPDISEEMQQRIEETAKLLNYHPNQLAISFRNQHSKLLGLIIPDIPMFYFPGVIKAVMTEVKKEGYNLIVLQSNEELEREIENVAICKQMNVEGLLVCITKNTQTYQHFEALEQIGIPVVYFDKTPTQMVNHSVTFDDISVAQTAIRHLLACKAKKILCVLGNENLSITQKRQKGCQNVMLNQTDAKIVGLVYANNPEEAKNWVNTFAKGSFDAVFCMSDEVLTGTMQALHEQAIEIPSEVQVIAVSDGVIPYYYQPNTTFVKTSGFEIGETACLELLRLIKEKATEKVRNLIQATPLVLNQSTLP